MNRFATAVAAVSLALTAGFAVAQMSQGGPERGRMHEGMKAAHEACKDKPDRRACMTERFCAKSQDPAKCQARAKERGQHMQQRAEQRQKMHEACNGKRGDDLAACLKTQKDAFHKVRLEQRQKAHEACNAKRGDDLIKCLREQPGGFGGRGHHGHGGMHGIRS